MKTITLVNIAIVLLAVVSWASAGEEGSDMIVMNGKGKHGATVITMDHKKKKSTVIVGIPNGGGHSRMGSKRSDQKPLQYQQQPLQFATASSQQVKRFQQPSFQQPSPVQDADSFLPWLKFYEQLNNENNYDYD